MPFTVSEKFGRGATIENKAASANAYEQPDQNLFAKRMCAVECLQKSLLRKLQC